MNDDLHSYIRQARDSGADHKDIKDRLVDAGWHPNTVSSALDAHAPETPPVPGHNPPPMLQADRAQTPIAVVQTLTTRGVEYYLMLISLAVSAASLGAVLHNIATELFSDASSYSFAGGMMSFAGAALLVSLPLFILFFLRLKKAELTNPSLLADPSRRRAIQIALIVTFVAGIISAIGFVFALFNLSYGTAEEETNVGLTIADLVITVLIVGGIFTYYWLDSHRKGDR